MRDRLIELLQSAPADCEGNRNVGVIADYLLANGVIVPPCKVGDVVYAIVPTYSTCHLGTSWNEIACEGCEDECDSHGIYAIREEIVEAIAFNKCFSVRTNKSGGNYKSIGMSVYGVLLTREEAERALAERSGT